MKPYSTSNLFKWGKYNTKLFTVLFSILITSTYSFGQCSLAPNSLNISVISSTSVNLDWNEQNSATEWQIEYDTAGFTQGTGNLVVTTTNPHTLGGLTAETDYDWYVRSICGPADTSAWSSASSFTTPCVGVSATFTENFDGVSTPNLPNCWSTITPSATTIQTVTSTDHGVPIPSSPNALEINDAATDILISPLITDLSSGLNRLRMQIAFEGGGTTWSDTLFVGVTNSQTNAAAFVPLDTITMENTDGSFKEYSFHFDNPTLVGSNNFIAFSYKTAGGGYEYFIDDFNYEPIPSCIVPSNLSASNITNTSADIDWVEQNSATEWEIEYGTVGFTQGTGTTVIVNSKPHNLNGLTTYSSYDYYVRSICTAGDTSRWSPNAYTFTVGLPLAGVYTIDSAQATGGTNFQSFSDFGNVASLVGVSGPVQINVAPGIYYDQLSLYDIQGSSAANPILINGQNSSQATLSHDQSVRNSTITLERVKHIEIKNLTIEATATSDAWGIHIFDSSHHISIDSNIITMPIGSYSDVSGIMISGSETSDNSSGTNGNYIGITNNEVIGGERGVSAYGSSSPLNRALLIENNSIHSADDNGIYIYYYDSVAVRGNTIDNLQNTGSDALYMSDDENFEVSGNYLRGQDNGMDADDLNFNNPVSSNSFIFNNMFIGDDDGAYFDDCESISFYHNSFRGEDYGMYVNDHLNWDVRNNIFYSNSTYAFYNLDSLAITMDYNIYHTNGTNLIYFSGIYSDLTAFQTGIPSLNTNSLQGDPGFATLTNLHLTGTLANDVGDNSVGITTDIDGDTRPLAPSTTVDIGADEYNPPTCPNISGLTLDSVGGNSISISWIAGGSETQWQIEYDTIGFTQGTGSMNIVSNTNATISGLSPVANYDLYVRAICGPGDSSIWIGPITALTNPREPQGVSCTTGFPTIIFSEEFDAVNGWTGDLGSSGGQWEIPGAPTSSNTGPSSEHSGPAGSFTNYEASSAGTTTGSLISPAINLGSNTGGIELSFWMHAYGVNMGTLNVGIGTSATGPFTTEFTWSGELQKSGTDPWINVGVDLSAYVGQTIYIEFAHTHSGVSYEGDMSIDLVEVTACVSCPSPTNFTYIPTSTTSADVSWISPTSAPNAIVEYGPAGFTLGSGTQIVSTSTTESITGLLPNVAYEVYVKDSCAIGDTSAWVGPITFAGDMIPCDDFDVYNTGNAASQSILINGWGGTVSGGGDAEISTDYASSGTQSLKIHDSGTNSFSDVVAELDTYNSGKWNVAVDIYIPSGNGGYYNILHNYTGATNVWAIEVTLDSNGTATVEEGTNGSTTIGTYSYNTGAWNIIEHIIDLDNDTAYIKVNGVSTTVGWQFSLGSTNFGDQFNAMNFYSTAPTGQTPLIYFDNFCVTQVLPCTDPTNLTYTPTSTTSADVSWTSTASAANAIVEYGPVGFSIGSGTRLVTTTTTQSITGLTPNVAYEVYVKDSCAVGDTSNWIGPLVFGGDMIPCDDFDAYSPGNAASQSILINGWGGTVAGGGDAEYSTDYANSGTQSLKIHDSGTSTFSDVVAELDTYNSGKWNVAVDLYIPTSNGGYYNILHNYTGPSNVWAIEVTLDSNGTATVVEGSNGTATIGTYTYNTGAWNTIEHIIDLDNDTAYIRVNGVNTNVGWQFSLGSTNFGDQFNAMNFFSTAPTGQTPLIYFDNFCVTEVKPYYPIAVINTEDGNGDADSLNVECSISGTLTGFDREGGNGYEFALIDLSTSVQEGITVVGLNDVTGYTSPTEGDSLLVFGVVEQLNGLTQFRADSIVLIGTGTVPSPDPATTLDESTESILIQMNDWILLDSSKFSGSYTMRMENLAGTDTVEIAIDSDSEISDSLAIVGNAWVIGDTICSLVGVGSQNDPTAPYLEGYQVFPSLYADVTVCKLFTGIQKVDAVDRSVNIYPNPTVGQFTVASSGLNNDNAIVTVRDISGRIVLEDNIANSNSPFTKQYDLNGKAKGLYFISIIDGEERINQKLIVQ